MIDVVGIGEGGDVDLTAHCKALVLGATILLGGPRHLDLVPEMPGQTRRPWPSPLRAGLPALLAEIDATSAEPGQLVALASGDPLLSGIGTTLVGLLGAEVVRIHPAVSSETLARARMGWSFEEAVTLTVVGRSVHAVLRHLHPGARLVVLCSDGATPAAIADLLCDAGCGDSVLTAWWHLGGPSEDSRTGIANEWPTAQLSSLVLLCVEVDRDGALRRPALGLAPGRPETAFEHDRQISKRDVRASAIAHLRPAPGQHLWDLGAGSGAVGIEWALSAPTATVSAVEHDPARAARIATNADRCGVPADVTVTTSDVLPAIDALPRPDAVFVGGGLTHELLDGAWARMSVGGRFVAHAVTLGTEAVLVSAYGRYGGDLTRINIEHAEPLGRHLSWKPARPVVQWSATKEIS